MMSVGFAPASIAVVYTYGLNDDPTWRCACVARLNCDRAKSLPPTIASTSPLALSNAIIEACPPESCCSDARSVPSAATLSTLIYTKSPIGRKPSPSTSPPPLHSHPGNTPPTPPPHARTSYKPHPPPHYPPQPHPLCPPAPAPPPQSSELYC